MKIIPAILIASIALALGAILPVKADETPTPTPSPTATPLPEAVVTIRIETTPRNRSVAVSFDVDVRRGEYVRDFTLVGDKDYKRFHLEEGRYQFTAQAEPGWTVTDTHCTGRRAAEYTTAGTDEAFIETHDGREFECTFEVTQDATPTPTPEPTSTPMVAATPRPATVLCGDGSIIQVTTLGSCPAPVPTATPVQVVAGSSFVIKPPATGDGGLLN